MKKLEYRQDLDFFKGIAIIAVVLYHMGILRSGYLGVDVFLVINGYLVIPKIVNDFENNTFHYTKFIGNKLKRLFPCVCVGCIVALLLGICVMLPYDLKILAEQITGSLTFTNNIILSITAKDYWAGMNEYHPLMHTWYLGVLMQFYIVIPVIIGLASKLSKRNSMNFRRKVVYFMGGGTLLSLVIYLIVPFQDGVKFYHLLFRFFELGMGGIVGVISNSEVQPKKSKLLSILLIACLLVLLGQGFLVTDFADIGKIHAIGQIYNVRYTLFPKNISVVLVAIVSSCLCIVRTDFKKFGKIIAAVGKRSYSIYIWHQIIIAFYRYCITYKVNIKGILILIGSIALVAEVSYRTLEKIKIRKFYNVYLGGILLIVVSVGLYMVKGVIHDYNRINLSAEEALDYVEFNAAGYSYDREFSSNDKIKCLCVGNSFARDWINILLNSEMCDEIEISYEFEFDYEKKNRVMEADVIFNFGHKSLIPDWVYDVKKSDTTIWGIGTKSFGECFGINYLNQLTNIRLDSEYEKLNDELKSEYGINYIDLLSCVINEDGTIRLYDDQGKYLSADTEHLTENGAMYFATKLDFERIFEE